MKPDNTENSRQEFPEYNPSLLRTGSLVALGGVIILSLIAWLGMVLLN